MTRLSVLCAAVAIGLTGLRDPVWATDSQLGQGVKDDAEAHYTLGNALREKGDLDGAIHEYRQAIGLRPDDANTHYNLGIALKDKGDLDGAISEYRQAIRIKPDFANAHYNLGVALRDKKDNPGAVEAFRAYIRLSTDEQMKQKVRDVIRELGGTE